jgi:hypothetical protein
MAEWLKAHAWKACVRETVPWVRIPLSPPAPSSVLRASAAKILKTATKLAFCRLGAVLEILGFQRLWRGEADFLQSFLLRRFSTVLRGRNFRCLRHRTPKTVRIPFGQGTVARVQQVLISTSALRSSTPQEFRPAAKQFRLRAGTTPDVSVLCRMKSDRLINIQVITRRTIGLLPMVVEAIPGFARSTKRPNEPERTQP